MSDPVASASGHSEDRKLNEMIDGWLEWVVEIKGPHCDYDHHGLCQAHNLDSEPCPMEGIVAYVRSLHGITT